MDFKKYNEALRAAEEVHDCHIFIYSAPVNEASYGDIVSAIKEKQSIKKSENCILILTTTGGLANSAYKISRLFQQSYGSFSVYPPRYCKSAGTIIALGAHTLIMDEFSELGPLDVQILDKDEIGGRKSGLLTRSAFESLSKEALDLFSNTMIGIKARSQNMVSFKLASEIAWKMTAELMSPIFGQLNPEVIGSDFRDLSVAVQYGERLAKNSKNAKALTVHRLVTDYPSHDFIIDREEANTLFNRIEQPSRELYNLIAEIAGVVYHQASPGVVMGCTQIELSDEEEVEANAKQTTIATDEEASGVDRSGRANRRRNTRRRGEGSEQPRDSDADTESRSED